MTRLAALLASLIVVAQLDLDARPARCWVLSGVDTATNTRPGPFWLSRSPPLAGWMTWQPVRGGDVDAAARAVGFKDARGCL